MTIYLEEHEKCDVNFLPSNVFYMSNHLGTIRIKTCNNCSYDDAECLHLKNDVDTKKGQITCLLCGAGNARN